MIKSLRKQKFTQSIRASQTGASLAMSAGLMTFLAAFIIGVTVFLANTGMLFYYNQQLQLIAMNASQFAQSTGGTQNPDMADDVVAHVNGLLTSMGLPAASLIVCTPNGPSIRVAISVDGLRGFGGVPLPTLTVAQSAVPFENAEAYLRLEFVDGVNGFVGTPMVKGGAYLPVLRASQLEPDLRNETYMLDTDLFPATRVIYHKEYRAGDPGLPSGYVWPNYR